MKIPSEKHRDLASPSGTGNPFEHRVARAISACTRCRSRKSKCDGKLPACTACEKAKVECIGFDAISKKNVSRSYIHELEQEVLALRAQLGLEPNDPIPPVPGPSNHHLRIDPSLVPSINTPPLDIPSSYERGPGTSDSMGPPSSGPYGSSSYLPSPHAQPHEQLLHAARHARSSPHGHRDSISSQPTMHDINHVVSDTAFIGDMASAEHRQPVGHFMGAASGVSLTRMVLDAVLRSGPASAPPASNRETMIMPTQVSRRDSEAYSNANLKIDPSLGRRNSNGPASASGSDAGAAGMGFDGGHSASPVDVSFTSPSYARRNIGTSPLMHQSRPPISVPALPPPAAVDRLVQVYVDFVQIMLPIMHMPTFQKMLARVRGKSPDVTDVDIFFVLMVLALSTMALSRSLDPTAELRMSSEAFYIEAIKHMEAVFEDNTYVGLQAILLCCYYSMLNPSRGSIWFLVGLASRVCVDHGFHQETPEQTSQVSPLELDMRRRLFAATYNLDRLLSHALGRPPSIPDGYIDVAPFSNLPDDAITDHGLLPTDPDPYKIVALNFIPLRELQSAINERLYSVRSEEPPSQEWFLEMFDRLKTWLANSPEPKGSASAEGYAISFHNTVLLLFRPSPACPRPSRDALATCLSSSSYIIRIFRRMHRTNKINWYWLSSHYVFMAGITYLYGLWNMNMLGDSSLVPSLNDAQLDIQACLTTLAALSVTVPAAGACKATFEMLSTAIMKRLQGEQNEHSSAEESQGENDGPRHSIHGSRFGGCSSLLEPAVSHAESAMRHSFQSQGYASPLPKLSLPNELNMLDQLFQNPMCPHPKASDSTAYRHGGYPPSMSTTTAAAAARSPGYYAQNGNVAAAAGGGGGSAHVNGSTGRNGGNGGGMENGNGQHHAGGHSTADDRDHDHDHVVGAGSNEGHSGGGGCNKGPIAATTPQDPATNMYYANGGSGSGSGGVVMPYGESELAASGFDFLSFLAADDGGQGANAVWEQTEPYRQDMPMLG